MPEQKRVGFEDQRGVIPMLDTPGEENKPEAIGLGEAGLLNLTVEVLSQYRSVHLLSQRRTQLPVADIRLQATRAPESRAKLGI